MSLDLDVVIVATGPSLTPDHCSLARVWRDNGPDNRLVLAINNAWELCPWADCAYAADSDWFMQYGKAALQSFKGQFYTGDHNVPKAFKQAQNLRIVPRLGGTKLPADDESICTGGTNGHSGFQALCVAAKWGARRIGLLGYDGKHAADGSTHCHIDHPAPLANAVGPHRWLVPMADLAAQLVRLGVKVTNLSPDTAYTCFDKGSASQWLAL